MAGDTAVLGETGNYTVVFCLAPATRRTESTANVLQMTFPFADRAGRDAAYAEALSLLNGLEGADAFLARAEEVGDVQHLKNTWRAELPYKVAEWLARGPAVDSSYLIEVEDAFLLVCYEGEGELAVWEKQAVFYLQEAELSQLLAADPVEHVKLGKLLLLL